MRTTAVQAPARYDFVALGTGCTVLVADPTALDRAVVAAQAEIDAIDRACSRFRSDSDLEQVNAGAGRAVRVGRTMLDAVQVALDAARWTDGDVDPTIGQALRLLGYDRDFADVRDGLPVAHFAEVSGWQVVTVDHAWSTVRVPIGVRLDLGATAKAFAADRAASAAFDTVGAGVLIGLGGDLAFAGEPPTGGWHVRVTDWSGADPTADGQSIMLHGGGLATSSTRVRRWRRGEREVHHVVDPATGEPAAQWWTTVSVAAASCVQANIATTASIVRGESARDWLESLHLPARLVRRDGEVVTTGGWPRAARA